MLRLGRKKVRPHTLTTRQSSTGSISSSHLNNQPDDEDHLSPRQLYQDGEFPCCHIPLCVAMATVFQFPGRSVAICSLGNATPHNTNFFPECYRTVILTGISTFRSATQPNRSPTRRAPAPAAPICVSASRTPARPHRRSTDGNFSALSLIWRM